MNYNFNMAFGGHFAFCQKKDVPLRGNFGLFTGNKRGHNEHFLNFSALYYFFPFQNLKFLDYLARCVALRHHDSRVGGSVPGLGNFNTVTHEIKDVPSCNIFHKIKDVLRFDIV